MPRGRIGAARPVSAQGSRNYEMAPPRGVPPARFRRTPSLPASSRAALSSHPPRAPAGRMIVLAPPAPLRSPAGRHRTVRSHTRPERGGHRGRQGGRHRCGRPASTIPYSPDLDRASRGFFRCRLAAGRFPHAGSSRRLDPRDGSPTPRGTSRRDAAIDRISPAGRDRSPSSPAGAAVPEVHGLASLLPRVDLTRPDIIGGVGAALSREKMKRYRKGYIGTV